MERRLDIALELPVQQLGLSNLVDFEFVLAHLVLQHSAYRSFYVKQSQKGRNSMLDNGMWESGGNTPLTLDDLCTAIGIIQPTEVIVPDVLHDMAKTIANAKEWLELQTWHPVLSNCSFQLVVQGKNWDEALGCYKQLLEMALKQNDSLLATHENVPVITIAFPLGVGCAKLDKSSWAPMREAIIANLAVQKIYDDSIKIHLMSIQDPAEMGRYLKIPGMPIKSCDTGAPIRAAKMGIRYDEETGKGERVEGILDPDEMFTFEQVDLALHNIRVLRKFTGHGSA